MFWARGEGALMQLWCISAQPRTFPPQAVRKHPTCGPFFIRGCVIFLIHSDVAWVYIKSEVAWVYFQSEVAWFIVKMFIFCEVEYTVSICIHVFTNNWLCFRNNHLDLMIHNIHLLSMNLTTKDKSIQLKLPWIWTIIWIWTLNNNSLNKYSPDNIIENPKQIQTKWKLTGSLLKTMLVNTKE